MSAFFDWLKVFKERVEPIVWLIVSVLVPVVGGLLFTWSVFISPKIAEYAKSLMSDMTTELKKQGDALEAIKHKIADDFDSTYYFTKTYSLSSPDKPQEPLTQFFYAGPEDVVYLFIWSSGRQRMKMTININDGPSKSLETFHKRSWTNVDITEFVKNSSTLTEEQYQGISENVYNISITPIPNQIPQKLQRQREAIQASPQKVITPALQGGDEVDVYALLIVRRGPVK